MSYEDLWKAIIRPPRDHYTPEMLGAKDFYINNNRCLRTDFELMSVQGYKIVGSHFEPAEASRISPILPCVIFLHGNCSSRLEALNYLFLLSGDITLVAIDLPGCGLSEGEYISLGWYEQYDLANLVDFLREERRVGGLAIWGRSMGAVTAILYASNNPKGIQALVLDSPFSNFKQVALHLARKNAKVVPGFLLKIVLSMVRNSIKIRAKFDINKLKPGKLVEKIKIPAFICFSFNDELVPYIQFDDILSKYGGEKEHLILDGGHNDVRTLPFCRSVGEFLCKHLEVAGLEDSPINIPPHLWTEEIRKQMEENENEFLRQHREVEGVQETTFNHSVLKRTRTVLHALDVGFQTLPSRTSSERIFGHK